MFSPTRWFKKRVYRLGIKPRVRRLGRELSTVFPQMDRIVRSSHDGGYDSIYLVIEGGEPRAVVRLNNPLKRAVCCRPGRPRVVLAPRERLAREWAVHERLAPLGLTPDPLWRCEDAIMCSFVRYPRLRTVIEGRLALLEKVLQSVFDALERMHREGIAHLDLTPGNVLVCPETLQVRFIDFEYGPAPAQSFAKQCEFDILLFMAKLLTRGAILSRLPEFEVVVAKVFRDSPARGRVGADAMSNPRLLDLDDEVFSNEAFLKWFADCQAGGAADRRSRRAA